MATSPPHNPIVTLTTDFGQRDGYVGAMQGVILDICPSATISTISHDIPPQDIQAAAFVLYQAFNYYPRQAIHCVVVDPGVGSERRAVAMRTSHGIFVGPDNGVFSVIQDATEVLEAVTLTNPRYQLARVSATFHGRDIFSPACAHLATGVSLAELGPPVVELTRFDFGARLHPDEARIIHIDHFGNLILDLTAHDIAGVRQVAFKIGHMMIRSLGRTFSDVDEGELLAYVGSSRDHVEIGLRNGNAAKALGLHLNDVVQIVRELD
jgi:S-adenosylmethionine hydrolase